ncbi:sulfurtransferase TusA family protein [Photobacterium sp. GJ3]|uniref:sulfurtransferase TusA family protein n=1 Tax=Photobacterium sp. GJ3 TaxID=2829502 RepID=UPI001B8C9ED9|nr:sulfurtransferase TusA family protein [Photobacterium sp. GJ3]QUJ66847.1 sulfurtransferase TusA family protein [Photobacterium sp. GJ3]
MEIPALDLTQTRCPMALLLAKRGCRELASGQSLELRICDAGARQDIPRYLLNQGYEVLVQTDNSRLFVITVTKRL